MKHNFKANVNNSLGHTATSTFIIFFLFLCLLQTLSISPGLFDVTIDNFAKSQMKQSSLCGRRRDAVGF